MDARIIRRLFAALLAVVVALSLWPAPQPAAAQGGLGWLLTIIDTAPGGAAADYQITTITGETLSADCAICWGGPAYGPVDLLAVGSDGLTIRDMAGQIWRLRRG